MISFYLKNGYDILNYGHGSGNDSSDTLINDDCGGENTWDKNNNNSGESSPPKEKRRT